MSDIRKITFSKKPINIPADYRPMYKISQIVLILSMCCRSETSSLLKLHLLSWALYSEDNRKKILDLVHNNFQSELAVWGIEPALNRAVKFAIEDKIISYNGRKYTLSDKGKEFANKLMSDSELLSVEKEFLGSLGKNKITDSRIDTILKKWSLFND